MKKNFKASLFCPARSLADSYIALLISSALEPARQARGVYNFRFPASNACQKHSRKPHGNPSDCLGTAIEGGGSAANPDRAKLPEFDSRVARMGDYETKISAARVIQHTPKSSLFCFALRFLRLPWAPGTRRSDSRLSDGCECGRRRS